MWLCSKPVKNMQNFHGQKTIVTEPLYFEQFTRNSKPVHMLQNDYDTSTNKRCDMKRTCWGEGSVCTRRRRFLWSLGLSSMPQMYDASSVFSSGKR